MWTRLGRVRVSKVGLVGSWGKLTVRRPRVVREMNFEMVEVC